jgi:hypothetical protein
VDCYFTDVKDKLKHLNDMFNSGSLNNGILAEFLQSTYEFEKDKRQELLNLMVGGVELSECCIKNSLRHGINKMDRHFGAYTTFVTTYHFLYNEKLCRYGDGSWMKRLTYGGKVNKHFGYCGKYGFFGTPDDKMYRWTLDDENLEQDYEEVFSYILFGMMLDCMNTYSFHDAFLFTPYAPLYRCINELEYDYQSPVSGKKVGASLWFPYGRNTVDNKLPILQLKDYISVYNDLPSMHTKLMKKVGKSTLDWYSI